MSTLVLSVVVVAVSMAVMAVGVLFGRSALRSGCHCLATGDAAAIECEGCLRSTAGKRITRR